MKLDANMLSAIKEEYGDAFYLLDSRQFRENYKELRRAFGSVYNNFNIAYSYKTNYTPKLCKIVNDLGGYAEVVSEMEMELALKCGVEPRKIIWNGPIKNQERVKIFLLNGGTVNIDSVEEAEFICSIAQNTEKKLNVGIRCNYDVKDGVTSRFGLDIDGKDFVRTLELIKSMSNLYLINLQCHFAKRQIQFWPNRVEGMIKLIQRMGFVPERIDIGGGLFGKMKETLKKQFTFPIPQYIEYAEAAAKPFADFFQHSEKKPELIIEPGSALVGDCMKFVGIVKTIKNVRGKYFASILGSQKNISMAGINPPIEIVPMGEPQENYHNIDLVGYTCIEGDILYSDYDGSLAKGDAVVISNCGSYSVVMKPPFILPNFPILDISEGEVEVIKRGETFDDIFHTFMF